MQAEQKIECTAGKGRLQVRKLYNGTFCRRIRDENDGSRSKAMDRGAMGALLLSVHRGSRNCNPIYCSMGGDVYKRQAESRDYFARLKQMGMK